MVFSVGGIVERGIASAPAEMLDISRWIQEIIEPYGRQFGHWKSGWMGTSGGLHPIRRPFQGLG